MSGDAMNAPAPRKQVTRPDIPGRIVQGCAK